MQHIYRPCYYLKLNKFEQIIMNIFYLLNKYNTIFLPNIKTNFNILPYNGYQLRQFCNTL